MFRRTVLFLGVLPLLFLLETGTAAADGMLTFSGAEAVPISELGQLRARGAEEDPELFAVLEGNSSTVQDSTFSNDVAGSAFANSAGWVTVIQNTGSNVLIQNTTRVNVNIH